MNMKSMFAHQTRNLLLFSVDLVAVLMEENPDIAGEFQSAVPIHEI